MNDSCEQPDPWWTYAVMILILSAIIGGVAAAAMLDELWPLLISVAAFCVLYAGGVGR